MPTISRIYGILIQMFYRENAPPHFHVRYGDQEASLRISDFSLVRGKLSSRALGLVREWAELHRAELEENWERAAKRSSLRSIEPLD